MISVNYLWNERHIWTEYARVACYSSIFNPFSISFTSIDRKRTHLSYAYPTLASGSGSGTDCGTESAPYFPNADSANQGHAHERTGRKTVADPLL